MNQLAKLQPLCGQDPRTVWSPGFRGPTPGDCNLNFDGCDANLLSKVRIL